jgi:UDP-glucose 4-epimerase
MQASINTVPAEQHLIIGGRGFIGRHVAAVLARSGHRVVIADHLRPDFTFPDDVASRISWRFLEFASADWDSVIADAPIIHQYAWNSIPSSANQNPSGDLTSNVAATISLLEAVRRRGGGRVIFPSSGGTVYGRLRQVPVSEDHPLMPITAYGAGKATAELYLGLYRALHGIDCRIVRISNPYGAGQNVLRGQGAATTFLYKALHNEPIVIWGDGEVVRDFVHIADVAEAVALIACIPEVSPFHIFNIGSGVGISLNALVSLLEGELNRKLEIPRMKARPFDIPVSILDITRVRDTLGWFPRISLAEGIRRTISDLTSNSQMSRLL